MDPLSSISDGESEENDAFQGFVEYARSMLSSSSSEGDGSDGGDEGGDGPGPSWSWIVSRILKTCIAYSSGVTAAILLSDLFQAWTEQHRYATSKKKLECMIPLKKRHRRTRLPNTVTIDSIYEKNFLSQSSILEAFVVDAFLLPGTNIYMLNLGDMWSSYTIDLYLHRRYYHLVDPNHGILKKGREIFLTGCCLRTAIEGSGHPRLLPTEYMVILLDEDQDEDAMLLGAQFCSDSFSSISLHAVKDDGASYSFYARIESIGPLEVQGTAGCLQRIQITLVDSYGARLKFLMWGDQVLIANLLSAGSMLALDRPFIGNITDSNEESEEICLEYGSATQLYLVPFVHHEEQVLLTPTQTRYQGSRLLGAAGQSQGLKVSQVSLPQNSEGSINFSDYPFRLFVINLHDKMTGISLCGVITHIERETYTAGSVFSVTIEDRTGAIVGKLHFTRSWSLGRLGLGHTVFVSGLTCSLTKKKLLQLSWLEKDSGSSMVDISSLPALLNSSCLHQLSHLSDLFSQINYINVCIIRLDHIELSHVQSMLSHSICGRPVSERSDGLVQCCFCHSSCDGELLRSFYLRVTIADESAKVFAWCSGQTAAELLQISPDELFDLPEDEQAMYLFTLENERFIVALVDSNPQKKRAHAASNEIDDSTWEITRAQKYE